MASGHRVAHGEAVAIDIALSSRIAILLGLLDPAVADADDIVHLLVRLGLPTSDPTAWDQGLMTAALIAAWERVLVRTRTSIVLPSAVFGRARTRPSRRDGYRGIARPRCLL